MSRAVSLALLSSLLLIGCAGEDANYNQSDLSASTSDLGHFCTSTIDITASPAPATPGIFYAPSDLIATATPNTGALEKPTWSGTGPDGSDFTPEVIDMVSGLRARYHADKPGSYTFRVAFPGAFCDGEKSVTVMAPDAAVVAYRFRVSPPTALGVPQQDIVVNVKGHTPTAAEDLALSTGDHLSATLKGPAGAAIAGEVRLLASNGAPDALALAPMNGLFTVPISNSLEYQPLLIPQDSSLAPVLLNKATGLAALSALNFSVDAGQAVSGTVRDSANAALPGVKMVLRSGKLPCGLGISAADGSYSLRAQPGTFLASIGADGWPELSLPSVIVPSSAATSIDVKYLVTRSATIATVLDSKGNPVAGARVTVRSPLIANAATVTIGGNPQSVSGRAKQVAVSAGDGTVTLQLLSGNYDVLVEPPGGASDGVTSLALAAAPTWSLPLSPKTTLSGKVTDLQGLAVAGVKVTAFETAGLGAAPFVMTSSGGVFSIKVDSGSPLEVLYEPPGSSNLSSLRQVVAAGATQTSAALAPGLRIAGSVLQGSSKLPSVVIEALCGSCGSDVPIASTISDAMGAYALYLPDPGVNLVDGGVSDAAP
jgi:hypothetical protein